MKPGKVEIDFEDFAMLTAFISSLLDTAIVTDEGDQTQNYAANIALVRKDLFYSLDDQLDKILTKNQLLTNQVETFLDAMQGGTEDERPSN